MFLTPSDFNILPYSIPNLSQVVNTFQKYVNAAEEKRLKELLGVELYYEFIEGLEALPADWDAATAYIIDEEVSYGVSVWKAISPSTNVEPIEGTDWTKVRDDKWLKLEKGFVFVYQDSCCRGPHTTEWLGVADMLKPYVFYRWTRDTWDNNSGIGVVQAKAENAEVIAPARRLVDAWNDHADKANTMIDFVFSEDYNDPATYNTCACCFPYVEHLNTFGL